MKQYFTIGMAGHIDHGKTSLTKALTNVDTDRLQEEKDRNISIELGFAPLFEDAEMQISIVDVPGHERFIRQMIAGVAGIDLVVLVVAADEGVMPQTREHLDILNLLGITRGIVALTKVDRVDEDLRDLAREELAEELQGTVFEHAPVLFVNSLNGEGVQKLNETIISLLKNQHSRSKDGDFRLPIDQVFTLKGQGTVIRGTVYEGMVHMGRELTILPNGLHTKARQIQVHHVKSDHAYAGQRTAINLAGIDYQHIKRGDVLVASPFFTVTNTIDVELTVLKDLKYPLKQRTLVKVHVGTSEVMGKVVFFDRNEAASDTLLCQIRLDDSIVVKRGDRFIIRRPTPVETIGGGWIINPRGKKYRFGEETTKMLRSIMKGTPAERLLQILQQYKSLDKATLLNEASLSQSELESILLLDNWITLPSSHITHLSIVKECKSALEYQLADFHKENPLLKGMNRGELIQSLDRYPNDLVEFVVNSMITENKCNQHGGHIYLTGFKPHLPNQWKKRCTQLLSLLEQDGRHVRDMNEYFKQVGIPSNLQMDFYYFFIQERKIVPLDDKKSYAIKVFTRALKDLKKNTDLTFDVGEAKEVLGISRKYIIPFLETLDNDGITIRVQQGRKWLERSDEWKRIYKE